MKEVYLIMSPSGHILIDITTNKGICYECLEVAEKACESKNRWSAVRGYGTYVLLPLVVEDAKS